jgi:hypothetical protein
VFWKPHANSESKEAIGDPLPKNVLTHLSNVMRDALVKKPGSKPLPDNNNNNNNNNIITNDDKTSIVLIGGAKAASFAVFKWMVSCCSGQDIQKFEDMPFIRYVRVLEVLETLDVPILKKQLTTRTKDIASRQIPANDIKAIYASVPANTPIRDLAIQSIGNAIYEKRLKNWPAYQALRTQIPEYEADIKEFLAVKRTPEIAAANDARRAAKKAYWTAKREEAKAKHEAWLEREAASAAAPGVSGAGG